MPKGWPCSQHAPRRGPHLLLILFKDLYIECCVVRSRWGVDLRVDMKKTCVKSNIRSRVQLLISSLGLRININEKTYKNV